MLTKELLQKLLAIAFVAGLLIGYFALHQFSFPAEAALHLSEGALIAGGASPYLDFWDNATPLILYLTLVPVFISRLTSLHPILIANLCTILLFVHSALSMALLSELAPARRNPIRRSYWPLFCAFTMVNLLQLVHFGQPDQVFFLLFCPYLCCRAVGAGGVEVPRALLLLISLLLTLACFCDPLYLLYWAVFEVSSLLSFYPFDRWGFVWGRFFRFEIKVMLIGIVALPGLWLALSPFAFTHYFTVVAWFNWCSFLMPLQSLSYSGLSTDFRFAIYGSVLCLIMCLPAVLSSPLTRMLVLSSLLGLGLMILQGGAIDYTNYLFFSFAAIALVNALFHYLRHRANAWQKNLFYKFSFFDKAYAFIGRQNIRLSAVVLLVIVISASLSYTIQLGKLAAADRYDLRQLGYSGFCDRRDLSVFSEIIEGNSHPNQTVAILGLALRPTYPLLTQLRRRPGLFITSGLPLDVLRTLELPMWADQLVHLKDLKKQVYERIKTQLASTTQAPDLVLIEDDEIRGIFDEYGLTPVLEANYNHVGLFAPADPSYTEGHPIMELIGFKTSFAAFRHKVQP